MGKGTEVKRKRWRMLAKKCGWIAVGRQEKGNALAMTALHPGPPRRLAALHPSWHVPERRQLLDGNATSLLLFCLFLVLLLLFLNEANHTLAMWLVTAAMVDAVW
eukprot:jgi/Chlat1/6951/Chrsp52S06641